MTEAPPRTLQLEGCVVDLVQRAVVRHSGERCALTALEAELLGHLARSPGQDVERDELLREVWGSSALTRAVDFTVRRLRAKLGEPHPPRHLLTVHGVGYRFVPLAAPPLSPPPPAPDLALRLATGRLDLDRMVFFPDGGQQPQPMSAVEGRVLQVLAASLGTVVPRERLIREVWGPGHLGRALEGTLSRLRAKLDPHKVGVLHTHRHAGVRLDGALPPRALRTNVEPHPGWIARDEQRAVEQALAGGGLVTLVGPGGTGKTALARQVALGLAQRGAEAWFVDLTRAGSDLAALRRVAEVLDVAPSAVAQELGARAAGTLLVLDNVEQLAQDPAFRTRLASWRPLAPGLLLLLTSRAPLELEDEAVIALGGLAPPQGAELYQLRAGLPRQPDPALVQVVVRLEGNPLAIELAAGRAERTPPAELLSRLDEQLDLLIRRPEGAQSQHSTLRAALDWSWDLLEPEARALLMRCSPMTGALDLPLVRSATGRPDAQQGLEALARQSLLQRDGEGYRWYELARVYAEERLARAPFAQQARSESASAVLESAEGALAERHGALRASAEQLSRRMPDLERLCQSPDPQLRGRAALALSVWSLHQGLRGEARAVSQAALERGVPEPVRGQLLATLAASVSASERGALVQAALAALPTRERASQLELARAQIAALRDQLRLDEALALSRSLAEQAREASLPAPLRGRIWLDLAGLLVLLGDSSWSSPLARAEELAREASDELLLGQVLRVRALALAQRDPAGAAACCAELVAVIGGLRSPALHQGALVKSILVEQLWGRLPELAPPGTLRPFDMELVIDMAAQLVASWLEPGTASARDPGGVLAFARAMGLLAAEEPRHALAMIPPDATSTAPLAALAMARAESVDPEGARDCLDRASGLCRSPSERRLVELAGAHLALLAGEPDSAERARILLAVGQVVPCAPGVTRELPIEVSLVRMRLEVALARMDSHPLAPDAWLTAGTAPAAWLARQRAAAQ
jgi:DNA-binding response OmpR family regulator/predicted ATPase